MLTFPGTCKPSGTQTLSHIHVEPGVGWGGFRFNKVPEKVPAKAPEKVARGFGAEPGQVQQGSAKGSGEASRKPWCKTKSGSAGFRRRFRRREALVQRQVKSGRL